MTTNGVPNDVLSNLDPLTLIIFIPICDLVVRNHHHDHFYSSRRDITILDIPSSCTPWYQVYRLEKNHVGLRHSGCIDDLGCCRAILPLQNEPLWEVRWDLPRCEWEPARFIIECVDSDRLVSFRALLYSRRGIDEDDACRYVLIALSEIFASITGLEYAFTKAPKNMRSLVMSMFLFTSAVASAIGEAFVCASNSLPL